MRRAAHVAASIALAVASALSAVRAAHAQDDEGEQSAASTDAERDAPAAPAAAAFPPSERALLVQAGAGLGAGTLTFDRPTPQGAQTLSSARFVAAELLIRARAWPRERFALELLLAYQTSIALALQASPLFAQAENVDVRWQRIELSAAGVLRLGQAANAPALAFPLGVVVRSLFPAVHQLTVPEYTVVGPQLGAELLLALSRSINVRVGPELQWLLYAGGSSAREVPCCGGIGIGARGAVEGRLGDVVRLTLAYGESHGFIPAGSWRFMDADRVLTLRVAGEL